MKIGFRRPILSLTIERLEAEKDNKEYLKTLHTNFEKYGKTRDFLCNSFPIEIDKDVDINSSLISLNTQNWFLKRRTLDGYKDIEYGRKIKKNISQLWF
jgi:hypothetical protein